MVRLWQRLRGGELSPSRGGVSVALGLFVGLQPWYGLHLPLCLGLGWWLRIDAVVAYAAANISNPLLAPLIIFAEVELGSWLLTGRPAGFSIAAARRLGLEGWLVQGLVGALVLGAALATLGGLATFSLLAWRRRGRALRTAEIDGAIARTTERYRTGARADYWYVRIKLRTDPAVRALLALGGHFGEVVDAGCGRGQVGLALLEFGGVTKLCGFDWDASRVAAARIASGRPNDYTVGDLRQAEFPNCDTCLLLDVLHYLPVTDQDALLARAAKALNPGGRLLVRDVERRPNLGSWLTRLAEQIGTRLGANRGLLLRFRSRAELLASLKAAGLRGQVYAGSTGTPLQNLLVVAVRSDGPAGD